MQLYLTKTRGYRTIRNYVSIGFQRLDERITETLYEYLSSIVYFTLVHRLQITKTAALQTVRCACFTKTLLASVYALGRFEPAKLRLRFRLSFPFGYQSSSISRFFFQYSRRCASHQCDRGATVLHQSAGPTWSVFPYRLDI